MTRRLGIWVRGFPVWFWFLVGAVGICAFTVGLIVSQGPNGTAPVASSNISPATPTAPTAAATRTAGPPSQQAKPAPVTTPSPTRPTATVTVTTRPSTAPHSVTPSPSTSAGTTAPNLPSDLASTLGGLLGLGRSSAGVPASGVGAGHLAPGQQ